MKDKNRTYSLTAKERKARRNGTKKNNAEDNAAVSREAEEKAMVMAQKRSKRSAAIVGGVFCVAVLLVIAALIIPVIAYFVNPYRDYDYVIARFELSNGMTLEYVIEEDEYDIAATNFIFLAKNGYFDNTVLVDAGDKSQNTDGWVRFGGYERQPSVWEGESSDYNKTYHHAQNKQYCENFTALPNEKFKNVLNKFNYDLYADKKGQVVERLDDIGVLAFLYDNSSTEFQMSYKEQPSNQVSVITTSKDGTVITMKELKPTMVGYALNDETIDNLVAIAQTAQVNTAITTGVRFVPPTPTIYIDKVKVYNLDGAKWDNFDFINYMSQSNDDGPRLRGWTGRA